MYGIMFLRLDSVYLFGLAWRRRSGPVSVNFSTVADGEDTDNPRSAIQFVNNAESSDFLIPHSRQFTDNRRAGGSALKKLRAPFDAAL